MKKLTVAFLFILILSCGEEVDKKIFVIDEGEFEINEKIKGETIHFDNVPKCPSQIIIIDSLLIQISGVMCDDKFFHVYKKDDLKHLGSFGNRGRGPNEFIHPRYTHQVLKTEDMIGIWVFDSQKFNLINVTTSIINEYTIIDNSIVITNAIEFRPMEAFLLSNGNITGKAMAQKGRLFFYNQKNDSTIWVDYFPKVDKLPFEKDMIDNLYIGPTIVSDNNSIIVSALELFKRVDVFSTTSEHLFSLIWEDSPQNPDFYTNPDNPIPGELKHYYYDLFLSDQYIYALNIDVTVNETHKEEDTGYSELHVFSLNGEPIAFYSLDHLVYSFSIDEENGYMYGLLLPSEEEIVSQVIRFSLSH